MAAPPTTPYVGPAAGTIVQRQGYRTTIQFAANPDAQFEVKAVTPPAIIGGDPVNITTMANTTYATKALRKLIEHGDASVRVAYDPNMYSTAEFATIVNREQGVTLTFYDGSTLDFWGGASDFTPDEITIDGDQPEATMTVVVTNYDPTNNVVAGPVMTQVAGT